MQLTFTPILSKGKDRTPVYLSVNIYIEARSTELFAWQDGDSIAIYCQGYWFIDCVGV